MVIKMDYMLMAWAAFDESAQAISIKHTISDTEYKHIFERHFDGQRSKGLSQNDGSIVLGQPQCNCNKRIPVETGDPA